MTRAATKGLRADLRRASACDGLSRGPCIRAPATAARLTRDVAPTRIARTDRRVQGRMVCNMTAPGPGRYGMAGTGNRPPIPHSALLVAASHRRLGPRAGEQRL